MCNVKMKNKYYCGIDVSKNKSNICLMNNNKEIIKEFKIKHDIEGFNKLVAALPKWSFNINHLSNSFLIFKISFFNLGKLIFIIAQTIFRSTPK